MRWLAEHAVAIRSANPGDADFADLAPLRPLLAGARVVLLGEQSHGDGAAFLLKTRLIRFLHEELGYDVLAFESGLYDCHRAFAGLRAAQDVEAAHRALASGIFGIWMQSRQLEPLVEYLQQRAQSERPLELCGFDCQLTGSASREHLGAELRAVAAGPPALVSAPALAALAALPALLAREAPPDAAAQQASTRALDELGQGLAREDVAAGREARELAFLRQLTRSLRALAAYRWRAKPARGAQDLAAEFNPRDAQMGENLVWLANERYPGRKIIVWAATMHIAREHESIRADGNAPDYRGLRAMGQHLHAALGKQAFAIGFTAHGGHAGLPWNEPRAIGAPPPGSLEDLCARAQLDQALVPLRAAPAWLCAPLSSRPLGYASMRADWSRVLDAIVFQRQMTPSTRQLTHEQKAGAANLPGEVERRWQAFQQRQRDRHPYADKGGFTAEWEAWRNASQPDAAQLAAKAEELRTWAATHLEAEGFRWRWHELSAAIAADLGDRARARSELEQAMAAYPGTVHAEPARQSAFQHLANSLCMLVWEEQGFAAALTRAAGILATEPRCHCFYAAPWVSRLAHGGEAQAKADHAAMVAAIRAAYEARAKRFPEHAGNARKYAAELEQGR